MAKKKNNSGAKRAAKAQKRKTKKKGDLSVQRSLKSQDFRQAQANLQMKMAERAKREYVIDHGEISVTANGEGDVKRLQFKPELLQRSHTVMEESIKAAINSARITAQGRAEMEVPMDHNPDLADFLGFN